jgi:hypothetical protein
MSNLQKSLYNGNSLGFLRKWPCKANTLKTFPSLYPQELELHGDHLCLGLCV